MAVDETLWTTSLTILKWLGVSSLAGFVALYGVWIKFPPEVVVDSVVDKSKSLSSESKIRIRNNGTLPALELRPDAEHICAKVGGLTMENCGVYNGPSLVDRLSGGESLEITVTPGIHFGGGAAIEKFSYSLSITHRAQLFFIKRTYRKHWTVELKNYPDGYAWDVSPT